MPYSLLESNGRKHALDALDIVLDERDRYTREHCHRLVFLSEHTGRLCGLENHDLQTIKIAAMFHDIGKVGIPDSILLKPSALEPGEWEIIRKHSEKGERIFRALDLRNGEKVAALILHHHEHYDGSGYPAGLVGEDIPYGARIISVADSYDAMTTTRSYSRARSHEQVLSIMHDEEGEKSDPYIFRKFTQALAHHRTV